MKKTPKTILNELKKIYNSMTEPDKQTFRVSKASFQTMSKIDPARPSSTNGF